ncbi:MAG: MFS transporter [Alphaproteobacteria bacterium]|jgi:MFS family permease|nr:MFS transporter [Alphaproteobacteria bacterium]MDP6564386.1 MFS transporter [Alphaproteobacteria bacterium]MDP6814801.1 MFS transporter [Alphaproteobacteria bacterium]
MFVLLLTVFVDLVGFGIILPILPFYAQAYGATAVEITLLVSTYSAVQIVSAPIWGRLSDRYGRKLILLATLAGGALAYLWFGFAGSLLALFAARALSGAMAGNIAVAHAYVADLTTPAERAGAMGRIGAAFGLGFVVGPALGGLLVGSDPGPADYAMPCIIAAAISFAAVPLGMVMLREPARRESKMRDRASMGELFRAVRGNGIPNIIGLMFLVTFVFTALMALFPLWCQAQLDWGARQVSYAYTYIGLLVAFMQGVLLGPVSRRIGEPRVLLIGAAALSAGLLLVPWVDDVVTFAANTVFMCLGTSFCHPTLTALISQRADDRHQGTVMGVANSVAATGRIVSPPIGGMIFASLGPNWPLLIGGFIMWPVVAAAVWMSWRYQARETL